MIGIGRHNVCEVPTNDDGTMKVDALAEMIAKGSFIDGVPVSQARKIAQSMMKSPEFLSEYTAGIESKEDQAIKLKALQTLIKNAGLA